MNFTLQLISFVLGKLYELVNSCVYDSYPLLLFCCAMVSGFIHTNLMKVRLLEVSRYSFIVLFFFFFPFNQILLIVKKKKKMTLLWFWMEAFKEKDLGFTF